MTDIAQPAAEQASNSITIKPPLPVPSSAPVPSIGGLPSADTVKGNLVKRGATPAQIDSILWLLDQGRTRKLSQGKLGALINRHGSAVSQVFSGTYGADLQSIVSEIDSHRKLLAQGQAGGETPIVDTWVLKEIGKFCELTRASRTVGILWGRSHTGKTTALQEHTRRNNHGRTIYVKTPPGGGARMFLLALARACSISERNAYDQLRDRLIRFFTPDMLLIVDEMHQTIIGRRLQTVTLELIRDLHDTAGCGLVLCGTPTFVQSMQDERMRRFFDQLDNRGVLRRKLPDVPGQGDLDRIINAYGLPPLAQAGDEARAVIKDIARESGLGKLVKFLQMARSRANKVDEVLSWDHFLDTHATLTGWAQGITEEEQQKGGR